MLLDVFTLPTVEAPPSYLQLFGKDEQGEDETDRGRQGGEREDGVAPKTSTRCCKCFLRNTTNSAGSYYEMYAVKLLCPGILVFLLGVGLPLTVLMITLGESIMHSVYFQLLFSHRFCVLR